MFVYVARRLVGMVVLLFIISFAVFSLLYLAPGSVEANLLGPGVSDPQAVAQVQAQYGLDDPFIVQFGNWLGNALQFDLGSSLRNGEDVAGTIQHSAGITLELMGLAFLLTLLVGIPLGVIAAVKAGRIPDQAAVGLAVVGVSAPAFVTGTVLLWLFGVELSWLPISGGGEGFSGRLEHLILPAIALALTTMATVVKITRSAMRDTLSQDYVGFARARGIPWSRVLRRYGLRNAGIPVLTASGLLIGTMVSTVVLVEETFSLPGLGHLVVTAVANKDIPLVQGVALVLATIVIVANMVADLLYALVDPRVRLEAKSQ